jgi:TatA/E family protein of Tat protein translocase
MRPLGEESVFGSIGGPELIIIFAVALLIFGPRKLPDLGRAIGRGMAEFRKAASDLRQTLDTEVARDESGRAEKATKTAEKESGAPGAADAGKRSESD